MSINNENLYVNNNNSEHQEIEYSSWNGCGMLLVVFIIMFSGLAIAIALPINSYSYQDNNIAIGLGIGIPLFIGSFFMFGGFVSLSPNEAGVVTLCGEYKGTIKTAGLLWINPFTSVTKVSLKANNLNGEKLKVNDKSGSPIEIAVVVVWKVQDTAKALFGVENYQNYVTVQSEAALRNLAYSYNYDKLDDNEVCLRGGHEEITRHLITQLNEKFFKAGIVVEEAKVTHLAYAPEIASSMLKRQQAEATIAARQKIIQGAVGIVHSTVNTLADNNICDLNQEQKAKLVSNLLLVLCSDSNVQPVISAGNL